MVSGSAFCAHSPTGKFSGWFYGPRPDSDDQHANEPVWAFDGDDMVLICPPGSSMSGLRNVLWPAWGPT